MRISFILYPHRALLVVIVRRISALSAFVFLLAAVLTWLGDITSTFYCPWGTHFRNARIARLKSRISEMQILSMVLCP
jgi:hypothetical protein